MRAGTRKTTVARKKKKKKKKEEETEKRNREKRQRAKNVELLGGRSTVKTKANQPIDRPTAQQQQQEERRARGTYYTRWITSWVCCEDEDRGRDLDGGRRRRGDEQGAVRDEKGKGKAGEERVDEWVECTVRLRVSGFRVGCGPDETGGYDESSKNIRDET